MRTRLLISVASANEVEAALAGGAALIDVKAPDRGPLGRADDDVIAQVVAAVAGRVPVSAALGEWQTQPKLPGIAGLRYVKWGLAGCRAQTSWRQTPPLPPGVVRVWVAYADAAAAQGPDIEEVFAQAASVAGGVLLLDTRCKLPGSSQRRRPTLLDWCTVAYLEDLCSGARQARVQIALAGSLGLAEIRALRHVRPTWFAVRGAACQAGDRGNRICAQHVAALTAMIGS